MRSGSHLLNIKDTRAPQLTMRNSCNDRFHIFGIFAARFVPNKAIDDVAVAARCLDANLSPKWNFFKITISINNLWVMFHHDCVLFVQHISENGLNRAFVRRSVVACAELFMDVDRATEGGIPRSSR
jgi:hypothetical protein